MDPTSTTPDKSGTEPEPKAPAPDVIPDKYDFKAPEGFEMDAKFIEEATPVLKELKITQDGGQKLFDLAAKHSQAIIKQITDQVDAQTKAWRDEIAQDKSLGNGRDNLSDTARTNIAAAIDAAPEELRGPFREAMDATNAGDHPAFVRFMNALGATFREGKPVTGNQPSPLGQKAPGSGPRSAAQAMYPNLPSSAT